MWRHAPPHSLALAKNPHEFATRLPQPANADQAAIVLAVRTMIARFLASDGLADLQTMDPDGTGPLFEAPVNGQLPEGLGFTP
jgi:hypothetical protein